MTARKIAVVCGIVFLVIAAISVGVFLAPLFHGSTGPPTATNGATSNTGTTNGTSNNGNITLGTTPQATVVSNTTPVNNTGSNCSMNHATAEDSGNTYTNHALSVLSGCVLVVNGYSGNIAGVDSWTNGEIRGLPSGTYDITLTDGRLQIVSESNGQQTYCSVITTFKQNPNWADDHGAVPINGWTC